MPRSCLQTAGIQLATSGLLLIGISAGLGEWSRLPAMNQIFAWRPFIALAYLVIAASVVAFAAFHWLMAREPASLVATSTYVNPIIAMLLGIAAVHERFSPLQLVGALAVLGSIILIWYLHAWSDPIEIGQLEIVPDP